MNNLVQKRWRSFDNITFKSAFDIFVNKLWKMSSISSEADKEDINLEIEQLSESEDLEIHKKWKKRLFYWSGS